MITGKSRLALAASWLSLAVACGGSSEAGGTLPDESGDLEVSSARGGFSSAGTRPAGPDLAGTRWRWMEAHCTEGPLDLSRRGYAATVRADADAQGLLLVYDQAFVTENCTQTVVQRAKPSRVPREWTIIEEARVAQPPTDACFGRMEEERPGEVRRAGELLEVLVQRSMLWCNGLEVRHVFAPAPPEPLDASQITRHYVAHFNRRDPARIARLFAESGSLVEPFRLTHTGGPTRHDGRQAISEWYRETLHSSANWLAMRLESVETTEHGAIASFSYMDPRLSEPLAGKTHFTVAAGEIFEARIELVSEPAPATEGEAGAGQTEGGGGR